MSLSRAIIRASTRVRPSAVPGWQCLHCGHQWAGRRGAWTREDIPAPRPRKCPACSSSNWFRPRVRRIREA